MTDFSHLGELHVAPEAEAEYVFEHPLTGEVIGSVWLRPMTDDNAAYSSERIRLAVERAERLKAEPLASRRKRVLSQEQIDEDREEERLLIARTCAVRWGTAPKDKSGFTPEFSEENCLAFLRALPNYMFDPFRGFAANVFNFLKRPPLDPGAGDELGNS